MKLTWKNTDDFLKKPPAAIPLVLIYGPDDGLVRERAEVLIKNALGGQDDPFALIDMSADQAFADPARVLDEAQAMSLMGGRKVIFVRDAGDKLAPVIKDVLAALRPDDNKVVITAGDLGPRSTLRLLCEDSDLSAAMPCYVEDEKDLKRVIQDAVKSAGMVISSDALQFMAQHSVGDRGTARQEIQKLLLYMGPQKNIDLDDVRAVIGNAADLSIDDVARFAASGQFAAAERILRQAASESTPAVTILRQLQNYFLRLHITKLRVQGGVGIDGAMAALKPPIFFKLKESFISQLQAWDVLAIEQVLQLLQTAEARTKQTGADPDLILSRAVLSISQMAQKKMARRA